MFVDNGHAIRAGGGDQSLVYRSSSGGIYYGSGDPNDFLVLNAGGYERFRIATNGNVGLGTTNPSARLDVRTPDFTRIQAVAGAPNGYGFVSTTTDASYSSYAELGSIGSSLTQTNFGQSIANWSLLWTGGSSSNGLAIGTLTSKPLILGTSDAERMRIDPSGNVGIGTSSPTRKLDVNGGTTSDGSIRAYTNGGTPSYWAGLLTAVGSNAASFFVRQIDTTDYLQIGSLTNNSSLVIKDSGNVGIGTASPTVPLQVSRSAPDQYLGWFENTQASPGLARLRVQNTATQGSFE